MGRYNFYSASAAAMQTDVKLEDMFSARHIPVFQWRRQLWGTGARAPSTSNNFIFSSLSSKSDSQLSKYCAVCEISWCKCQQLTALSISTALLT